MSSKDHHHIKEFCSRFSSPSSFLDPVFLVHWTEMIALDRYQQMLEYIRSESYTHCFHFLCQDVGQPYFLSIAKSGSRVYHEKWMGLHPTPQPLRGVCQHFIDIYLALCRRLKKDFSQARFGIPQLWELSRTNNLLCYKQTVAHYKREVLPLEPILQLIFWTQSRIHQVCTEIINRWQSFSNLKYAHRTLSMNRMLSRHSSWPPHVIVNVCRYLGLDLCKAVKMQHRLSRVYLGWHEHDLDLTTGTLLISSTCRYFTGKLPRRDTNNLTKSNIESKKKRKVNNKITSER